MKQMLIVVALVVVAAVLTVLIISGDFASSGGESYDVPADFIKTDSGLLYKDIVVGTGTMAKAGDLVEVNYRGTFMNGKEFDSNLDRKKPFEFPLGERRVIKGWDEGVAGMKVGGKRSLIIPPDLAYGKGGSGRIPGNSTLKFDVTLLKVN